MENITSLQKLIEKATSNNQKYPQQVNQQILELINSRVDMPKHAIAAISKRMALKNKNVLTNIFTLLEYLAYQCELSLYTQISAKQFLFKISGLLMNKDIDPSVKTKIMETIYCWEQLFRPHQDLLPLFFNFYAGLLRNNFDIPHDYRSSFRPAKLKQYKKKQESSSVKQQTSKPKKYIPEPSKSQQQTFQQIREKLILTNEIMDNSSPSDCVKDNALLIEMIEQLKQCQKKVNETINANPNQKIMQLALAANDDVFITYRRFKDLQRNKKPQPFILTELASDAQKQKQIKVLKQIQKKKIESTSQKSKKKEVVNILDWDEEPKKPQPKLQQKKEQNILDLDFEQPKPAKKQQKKEEKAKGDIFDLLGDQTEEKKEKENNQYGNASDLLGDFSYEGGSQQSNQFQYQFSGNQQTQPQYSGNSQNNGFNLDMNDFTTDADIKNNNPNVMDRLGDLTSDFLKRSK